MLLLRIVFFFSLSFLLFFANLQSEVVEGKLENGLTYYICKNRQGGKQVKIRLVVNVGSVQESDEEQGIAHFVEHMAFKGSRNFPPGEVLEALATLGAAFGVEVNAYTTFDSTRYIIDLPAYDENSLDKALLISSDWAFRLEMSDEEINKEREVILDEERRRRVDVKEAQLNNWRVLTGKKRYAHRFPIGLPKVVREAPPDLIRNFYFKWYHPQNMAVVVSGDVDIEKARSLIEKHFVEEAMQTSEEPQSYGIPFDRETEVVLNSDNSSKIAAIRLFYVRPHPEEVLHEQVLSELFHEMIGERLALLKEAGVFLRATSIDSHEINPARFTKFFALASLKSSKNALEALVQEIARAEVHGFNDSEFQRAKADMELKIDLLQIDYDNEQLQLCIDHFLEKMPFYKMEDLLKELSKILKRTSREDVHRWIVRLAQGSRRVISITTNNQATIGESELWGVLDSIDRDELEPYSLEEYEKELMTAPLITEPLEGGEISSMEEIKELGSTRLVLENGMKIIIKPTDYKEGEVLIQAQAKGGYNRFKGKFSKRRIPAVCRSLGIGRYSNSTLKKKLAGQLVELEKTITSEERELFLKTRPEDLETAFQLLHLLFFPEGMKREQLSLRYFVEAEEPFSAYRKHLVEPFRDEKKRDEEREKRRVSDVIKFCQEAFATPEEFTLFIIGDVKVKRLLPLIKTYLATRGALLYNSPLSQ